MHGTRQNCFLRTGTGYLATRVLIATTFGAPDTGDKPPGVSHSSVIRSCDRHEVCLNTEDARSWRSQRRGPVTPLQRTEADSWKPRADLGGGDAIPVSEEKLKARVIELVKKGKSTDEIVQKVPYLQPGSIRAIRAHVTLGSYDDNKKAKVNAD